MTSFKTNLKELKSYARSGPASNTSCSPSTIAKKKKLISSGRRSFLLNSPI